MQNEYEEKEQTIIILFQILFNNFGQHQIQIKQLSDLLNEFDLLVILQEIEPDILTIANMEDFTLLKPDAPKRNIPAGKRKSVKFWAPSVSDKHTNFVELMQLLKRFFENAQTGQMLRRDFNLASLVRVNELLKAIGKEKAPLNDSNANSYSHYNPDLIRLGEILLVISALSTKRDDYINTLNCLDEPEIKYLYDYMNIIENYISFGGGEKDDSMNNSGMNPGAQQRGNTPSITRVVRKGVTLRQNITQKEQGNLFKNIELMEKEIYMWKSKNEEITEELLDLGLKYRDVLRENEILKSSANQKNQIDEDSYFDSVLISQLKNDLLKKELEIEDIKRDNELMQRRQGSEVARLTLIIENLEQKCEELKTVKHDNEKLKIKIKEMNFNKDKLLAYDNLEHTLESKNRQIENLIKEKQILISQTENLIKDNFEISEKLKEAVFQKKKLEFEISDMKKEITHINKRVTRRTTLKNLVKDFNMDGLSNEGAKGGLGGIAGLGGGLEKLQAQFKEMLTTQTNQQKNDLNSLLEQGTALQDILEDTKEDCLNINLALGLEEDLDNMRSDLQKANRETKKQLEENKKLQEEISELKTDKENLKMEIKNLHSEIDKLVIEKEKLEIAKQKFDLDLQKHLLHQEKLEADKHKLVDNINELRDKIGMKENEIDSLLNEIENLKISLKTKTRHYDKLAEENKMLLTELENVPKGMNFVPKSIFSSIEDSTSVSNNGETKEKSKSPFEFNFMNKLKSELNSKNQQIKQLNEKVMNLEKLEEIFKVKDEKIESDYKFYKKSYEEQKEIFNQEHEVLSNKLCDLAMQMVNFKNELLKNIKPSILNQTNYLFVNK